MSQSCQQQLVEEETGISLVLCCIVSMVDETEVNVGNAACCERGILVVAKALWSVARRKQIPWSPTPHWELGWDIQEIHMNPRHVKAPCHHLLISNNVYCTSTQSNKRICHIQCKFYFDFTLPYYPCFPIV